MSEVPGQSGHALPDRHRPVRAKDRPSLSTDPRIPAKLAIVANVSEADLADRLARALEASAKVINARPMQVIEGPKADAGVPTEEAPDHSMVIPPLIS
jgi:hypothetical protein